jgi:hypothetical protein
MEGYMQFLASLPVEKIVLDVSLHEWLEEIDQPDGYMGPCNFYEPPTDVLRDISDTLTDVGKRFEVTYRITSSDRPSRLYVAPGYTATAVGFDGYHYDFVATDENKIAGSDVEMGESGDDAEVVEKEDGAHDEDDAEEEDGSQACWLRRSWLLRLG